MAAERPAAGCGTTLRARGAARRPQPDTPCVLLVALLLGAAAAGCGSGTAQEAAALTGGSPARGRDAIGRYGCGGCHVIPGIRPASGVVGPPLDRLARRAYLAGQVQNTPENLVRWIRHPQEIERGTAMPDMGVTEPDGRDIAAYLYTLR